MAKKENRPVIMRRTPNDEEGEENRLTVTFEIELSTFLSRRTRHEQNRPESRPTARHSISGFVGLGAMSETVFCYQTIIAFPSN